MGNETGIVGNPYLGGNVSLNLTPFTQFYINTLGRQQAKNEAAAKEYQSQAKLLTPTGMRGQDVNALMGAKNDWQNDWYKNKELILHPDRDNGTAWQANNELFNKANTVPTVSKDLVKGNQFIQKILSDPAKQRLLTDGAIERIRLHNLPLNDPNHRSITEAEFDSPLFNPKPLTPSEDIALTNLVNTKFKGEKIKSVTGDTDMSTYKRKDTHTYAPTSTELPDYLRMGETLYQNGQLAGEVNRIIDDHKDGVESPVYNALNSTYKKYFGKNITHPEEAATAILINKNANYGEKQEEVNDIAMRDAQRRAADEYEWFWKNRITNRQHKENISANKPDVATVQGNSFDKLGDVENISSNKGLKIKGGIFSDKENNPYTGELFITKDFLPSDIIPALKAAGYNKDYLEKSGFTGFTGIIKDGRLQGLKDKTLGLIDRQAMENAQLKFNTEPQKGKQPTFGKQQTAPTPAPKGTVQFEENGTLYNIPSDKVDAFIKAKPKAKRKS